MRISKYIRDDNKRGGDFDIVALLRVTILQ